jgi:hypothetical protein
MVVVDHGSPAVPQAKQAQALLPRKAELVSAMNHLDHTHTLSIKQAYSSSRDAAFSPHQSSHSCCLAQFHFVFIYVQSLFCISTFLLSC